MALACYAGHAQALAAEDSPRFAVACSAAKGRGTAVTSYLQLRRWTKRYAVIVGPKPMTTTSAVDSVALAFSRSSSYLSREGDNSKAFAQALYDPRHRVLALCLHEDAWASFSLVADVPPPPFAVVHADLADIATTRGIHLGAPITQVEAVYGRSRLVQVRGRSPQLSYSRVLPMPAPSGLRFSPEGVETWFAIANGHVESISIGTGF
jgi:hypothetical protein